MYIFKDGMKLKLHQSKASKVIGLTQPTLSNIMNRKVACRKVVAYAIVKYISSDAEIDDYFVKVRDGG